MKVLVTGGAGFIGSHLVDRLVKENYDVVSIDDLSTGEIKNVNPNCEFISLNITNKNSILCKLSKYKFDCVFHLAAHINLRDSFEDPALDSNVNIKGTLNIIQYVNFNKLIFTSTGGAIYSPENTPPWSEIDDVNPKSPYGISKWSSEKYIFALTKNSVVLRLANVYGPRQNAKGEAGVISIFIDNAIKNKPIKIFGDGLQTRDFVYVDDVVDSLVLSAKKDINGIFNVSTGIQTNILRISSLVSEFVDKPLYIEHHPEIKGEVIHSSLKYGKFQEFCGWRPNTDLYSGMKKTVDYYL